jgi:GNAT superfamily N-acetyltransferase
MWPTQPRSDSAFWRHSRTLAQPCDAAHQTVSDTSRCLTPLRAALRSSFIPDHGRGQGPAAGGTVRCVPTVSVRVLTAPTRREIEALAEIFDRYRAHYDEPPDGASSRRWLERYLSTGRLRAFVAEERGAIVGFATTTEVPASLRLAHFWQIRDLFVLPTHRRLGVARALLASVRAAAIEAGALRLAVQTEDDNDAALHLYAKSGYALVNGYCSLMLPLAPEPR